MSAQFSAIGIVTRDLERSLAFYRQLGLDIPDGSENQPHVEVALPGGLRLLWDTLETIQSFDPDYRMPADGHRMSLAFEFASSAEVDDAYAQLTRDHEGYQEPWDAFWGQRYAVVLDPDGNAIDLFAGLG